MPVAMVLLGSFFGYVAAGLALVFGASLLAAGLTLVAVGVFSCLFAAIVIALRQDCLDRREGEAGHSVVEA